VVHNKNAFLKKPFAKELLISYILAIYLFSQGKKPAQKQRRFFDLAYQNNGPVWCRHQ
jgi:hypothetical protein